MAAEGLVDPGWTENRARGGSSGQWREIWSARELVWFFALRDFQVRYKQAAGRRGLGRGPAARHRRRLHPGVPADRPGRLATACPTRSSPSPGCSAGPTSRSASPAAARCWSPTPRWSARSTSRGSSRPLASLLPPLVDLVVGLGLLAVLCVVYQVAPRWPCSCCRCGCSCSSSPPSGPSCCWPRSTSASATSATSCRRRSRRSCSSARWPTPAPRLEGTSRFLYALNPAAGALELGRFVLVGGPWPGWGLAVSLDQRRRPRRRRGCSTSSAPSARSRTTSDGPRPGRAPQQGLPARASAATSARPWPADRQAGPPAAHEAALVAARRQPHHRRRGGARHHRAQRRRQEHPAEAAHADHHADRGRGPHPRAGGRAAGGRHRLPPRAHRPGEHLPQRRGARHVPREDP